MPDHETSKISRRAVIVSAAIVPVAAIRSASAADAASDAKATVLTPDQLKLVEAFADRLIPKDENGPGATECGAAGYIDRQLAGYLASEKNSFVDGLAATNAYALKSHGKNFADLTPEIQDVLLNEIDGNRAEGFANSRAFFSRFRRLTLEGTFADPYYGGNKNFAGWDLIGYPGPRLAVGPDEQAMEVTIKPVRVSVWRGVKDGH